MRRLFLLLILSGRLTVMAGTPGAYHIAKPEKPEVRAAATFAVETESKKEGTMLELQAIAEATQQVVAGMNYKMMLHVTKGNKMQTAKVVVFRDLKSNLELKSWVWE